MYVCMYVRCEARKCKNRVFVSCLWRFQRFQKWYCGIVDAETYCSSLEKSGSPVRLDEYFGSGGNGEAANYTENDARNGADDTENDTENPTRMVAKKTRKIPRHHLGASTAVCKKSARIIQQHVRVT